MHSHFLLKNERSFCNAMQKLLTFFQQKIFTYLRYLSLKCNEMLTSDIDSFEHAVPDYSIHSSCIYAENNISQ